MGQKYGYIDRNGKTVIEPRFPQPTTVGHIGRQHLTDHSHPFRNGLTSIETGNGREWSVIDKTGRIIFTPSAGNYSPFLFSEGLLRYREKYSEGFLNTDGSVAVKPAWYTVEGFSEGLAAVSNRDKDECPDYLDSCRGFIDKAGNVVIKPQFASAGGFKGGLAWVTTRKTDPKDGRMFFTVGYIDRSGNFVRSEPNNW
jgi:WG containing repeat